MVDLSQEFAKIFSSPISNNEQGELIKHSSKFTLQLRSDQIYSIMMLDEYIRILEEKGKVDKAKHYRAQLDRFLELKHHEGSDMFIMKIIEHLSLKQFIDVFKVNIDKKT